MMIKNKNYIEWFRTVKCIYREGIPEQPLTLASSERYL